MTKNEGAILSAYTGIMLCDFKDMHEYAEKVLGRPIWTHEFGSDAVANALKIASEKDFLLVMGSLK